MRRDHLDVSLGKRGVEGVAVVGLIRAQRPSSTVNPSLLPTWLAMS
jgi:hypothetical protein